MLRTRIAPTPSGYLHFGNLYSFVLTWLLAKSEGGAIVLRIDDLDASRVREAYLEDIFKVLDFIGLEPDEGPCGITEFNEKYSQQKRLHLYQNHKEKLLKKGSLYACDCSRSQLLGTNPNKPYPGFCRNKNLEFNESTALRVKLPLAFEQSYFDQYSGTTVEIELQREMGDFVIWRKDGYPAYQLASVVDDDFFGINLIVRGEDLKISSGTQKWLARELGIKVFETMKWYHHPLILNPLGKKLSKSSGDVSVSSFIGQGISKKSLINQLSLVLNLPAKPYENLQDLLEEFRSLAPNS